MLPPLLQPPQLLIFDCDGVLVDSERLSHQVLCALLAEHGVQLGFDDAVARFIGASTATCITRLADLLGRPVPADFMPQFGQRCRTAFAAELRAVHGVEAVLDQLAVPFCVASNGERRKMHFTLGHTGLLPRFEGRMFSADDVARPKPAPDLFLHAAASLGVSPAQCLVIEDTATGIQAARAAGMQAWGYTAMTPAERLRDAGAHGIFSDMRELLAVPGLTRV